MLTTEDNCPTCQRRKEGERRKDRLWREMQAAYAAADRAVAQYRLQQALSAAAHANGGRTL